MDYFPLDTIGSDEMYAEVIKWYWRVKSWRVNLTFSMNPAHPSTYGQSSAAFGFTVPQFYPAGSPERSMNNPGADQEPAFGGGPGANYHHCPYWEVSATGGGTSPAFSSVTWGAAISLYGIIARPITDYFWPGAAGNKIYPEVKRHWQRVVDGQFYPHKPAFRIGIKSGFFGTGSGDEDFTLYVQTPHPPTYIAETPARFSAVTPATVGTLPINTDAWAIGLPAYMGSPTLELVPQLYHEYTKDPGEPDLDPIWNFATGAALRDHTRTDD